jgi:hypothetical protein
LTIDSLSNGLSGLRAAAEPVNLFEAPSSGI